MTETVPLPTAEGLEVQSLRRWEPYPAYRDAGCQWLGQIPEHWAEKPFKRLVTNVLDKRNGDELPFVALEHVAPYEGRVTPGFEWAPKVSEGCVEFEPGDVLFGKLRPYLAKCLLANRRGCCPTELLVFRPRPGIYASRFLYYLVLSKRFIALADATSYGTKMPRTSWEQLASQHLAIPPIAEQHAIAAFLDRETAKIDVLIATKERLIALFQEKRAALITQAVTKGLDPSVAMKDSGLPWLGGVPAHWEVRRLRFLTAPEPAAVKTGPFGSQLLASEMQGGDVKVYTQRNVIERDAACGDTYISKAKYEDLRSFSVKPGDVLLTTRASIGRCFLLPKTAEVGVLHPCLMRVRLDHARMLPAYFVYQVQDGALLATQLLLMSDATTIDVIYSDTLKSILVVIPPLAEQRQIVAHLDAATRRMAGLADMIQDGIQNLKECRTALISAAVSGKIDLRGQAA